MASTPNGLSPPADEEIEDTFRRLRRQGHSRLEALRVILDLLDVSLTDAKRLLASNDTWAEVRSAAGKEGGGEKNDLDGGDDSVPPAPA